MIDTVAFDFDGVIRHFASATVDQIEDRYGLSSGSLVDAAFAPDLATAALTGQIERAEWIRLTGQAAGSVEAAQEWLSQPGTIDPAMLDLMDTLRRNGARIALLTNATNTLPHELRIAGVEHRVDVVVNSFDVGAAKPDPAFFEAAREQLAVRPEAIYFTDDSQPNVDTAARLGIDSHLFLDASHCTRDLIERGVLPSDADDGQRE